MSPPAHSQDCESGSGRVDVYASTFAAFGVHWEAAPSKIPPEDLGLLGPDRNPIWLFRSGDRSTLPLKSSLPLVGGFLRSRHVIEDEKRCPYGLS
jgi:hypothetical protein